MTNINTSELPEIEAMIGNYLVKVTDLEYIIKIPKSRIFQLSNFRFGQYIVANIHLQRMEDFVVYKRNPKKGDIFHKEIDILIEKEKIFVNHEYMFVTPFNVGARKDFAKMLTKVHKELHPTIAREIFDYSFTISQIYQNEIKELKIKRKKERKENKKRVRKIRNNSGPGMPG